MRQDDYNLSWRDLMTQLPKMDEEQLRSAINYEVSTTKRIRFIIRFHQRYNKLRAARERINLLKGETLL